MDRSSINADLVAGLVADQFPEFANLPIRPVDPKGWDNVTFRLGQELSVRLPSDDMYVAEIEKEHRWLPILAPQLPLPIPVPVAKGMPSAAFPRPWSIYRWLEGVPAMPERIDDPVSFADQLAAFLAALYQAEAASGPAPGPHSFWRGGPLATWSDQVDQALDVLGPEVPVGAIRDLWRAGLDAEWSGPPVWVHGDVVGSNLLLVGGRLGAVIDFGCSAVGDPACDLLIAWAHLAGESRRRFRAQVPVDGATWTRARGWAVWKALTTLHYAGSGDAAESHARRMGWGWGPRQIIDQALTDEG